MSSALARAILICAAIFIASPTHAASFSFVAIGDLPYHLPQQLGAFEKLIDRINAGKPAFTIHVGDIKSGASVCDDAVYARTLKSFRRFEQPLVYTPGDNEWTDCHRRDNGAYDPAERLALLRRLFFASDSSLGKTVIPLERQSSDPAHVKYVENARWWRDGVLFATIHVVGSNNNLQRDLASVSEYVERNSANLAWLASSFDAAAKGNAKGVVVAFQADPVWQLDGAEDRRSGFTATVSALKAHVQKFGKPVLIVHGDRHAFVVDKPLRNGKRLLYNATRLIVFGDDEVHGVVVDVHPDDPDVFGFRTLTVTDDATKPEAQR